MLTRSGWLALGGAFAAAAIARIFAITELWVVAAGLALLTGIALIWVRGTAVRVRLHRTVTPAQVFAGESGRIQISATNAGTSATPVVELLDPVAGTRGAQLVLAPLAPDQEAIAAYRLPTGRRGVVSVGPLRLEVTDPFGLARRRAIAAGTLDVTVYPHLDHLAIPALGGEDDPHGADRSNSFAQSSDELFALRPYEHGDDLRRVHWKSTARTGELIVRQDESPWQHRTTVALDIRSTVHDADSFERAVSAAASVANGAFVQRHVLRFFSSDGLDSGSGAGGAHLTGILDHLARVEPNRDASLRSMLSSIRSATDGTSEGGLCVIVCGNLNAAEVLSIGDLTRRFRRIIVTTHNAPVTGAVIPRRVIVIEASDGAAFPDAWTVSTDPPARRRIGAR